jgi:macrolide transport system ATP-binding/permease protein
MPKWLKVVASRVRAWLSPHSVDEDFDEELRAHLEMLTDDNRRRGMPPDAAARAARITLGALTQLKEQYRERSSLPWIESLWQDARYALRIFGNNRAFTILAVVTIAIGIGVNTTVFTVINGVAFKRLPVRDADRLVRIERWFESGARGSVQYAFSWDEYQHYRQHIRLLSDVFAVGWPTRVATDGDSLQGLAVSDNYFAALGARAALGHTFLPTDTSQDRSEAVVVISDAIWRTRFGADPGTVGKAIRMNGLIATVIGIMPPAFIGTGNPPQVPEFWVPLELHSALFPNQALRSRPDLHRLQLLGYIASYSQRAQAESELEVLKSRIPESPETHIASDKTIRLTLQPATYFGGTDDVRFGAMVGLVMAVVAMILVAACANLANMLLARASARQREIGMRLALGATRARLVRQLLTENLLLAVAGGAAGFVVSGWASRTAWTSVDQVVRSMFFTDVSFVASMTPDLRIFAFAFGLSLATGLLVGLSPALTASRSTLVASLSPRGHSRLRSWSIGSQAAVAMAFLVCSGLFIRASAQSSSTDAGFDTRKVFTLFMDFDANPEKARALQDRLSAALTRSPGIESVALLDRLPFAGTWSPPVVVDAEGRRLATRTLANYVSPAYFQTAGIPIQRGRTFSSDEARESASVAIVSESAARRFWPAQDPIGKRVSLDLEFDGRLTGFEVVGVAKDVRSANLSRVDPAYVYLPVRPAVSSNILIRSASSATATYNTVRTAVAALDPVAGPGIRVTTLQDGPMMQSQLLITQLLARFVTALACIAIALAAVGIYGVTAYLVSQRTREIGIRMALGATTRRLLWVIVRQSTAPVHSGAVVGLLVAAAVSAGLHSLLVSPSSPDLLFGLAAWDPFSFVLLPMLLAAIAATASYVPARRAATVDPLLALRSE